MWCIIIFHTLLSLAGAQDCTSVSASPEQSYRYIVKSKAFPVALNALDNFTLSGSPEGCVMPTIYWSILAWSDETSSYVDFGQSVVGSNIAQVDQTP